MRIFTRTYNSWPWKIAVGRKLLVPPFTKVLEIAASIVWNLPLPYRPDPNGKPWIKNQAIIKPLKMIVSICCFSQSLPVSKNLAS